MFSDLLVGEICSPTLAVDAVTPSQDPYESLTLTKASIIALLWLWALQFRAANYFAAF